MRMEDYAGRRGEEGHRDGNRENALFHFPDRVFEDSIGRVYVGERAYIGLRRIDAEGSVRTLPLIRGADDEETPLGPHRQMFLTPDEVLYVSGGDRLWRARFDGDASSLRFAEGPRIMASDIVVHGERIFAATISTRNSRPQLIEVTWGGESRVIADLRGPGAGGIAATGDGSYFVAERERILRISPDGEAEELTPTTTPPPHIGEIWFSDSMGGMDLDGDGNVYVSDTYGDVLRMSPTGDVEVAVDLPSGTTDVLVASDGHLYVPDYHNHVILRSVDRVTPKKARV